MGMCSSLLLLGDLKNTSVPGGMGGRRHGKQRIIGVFVVFSCLFAMSGVLLFICEARWPRSRKEDGGASEE